MFCDVDKWEENEYMTLLMMMMMVTFL